MGPATGVVTRRLHTDVHGRFDSGILQSGEYCLLVPILMPDGRADSEEFPFARLQSRPLSLVAGVGEPTVDLDLAASAHIRLDAKDIPNSLRVSDESEVQVFVILGVFTDSTKRLQRVPLSPSDEPPPQGWPLPIPPAVSDIAGKTLSPEKLPCDLWVPPRAYSVELSLSFWQQRPSPMVFGSTPVARTSVPAAANSATSLTLSVDGEPLQKRWEHTANELREANEPATAIDIASAIIQDVKLDVQLTPFAE